MDTNSKVQSLPSGDCSREDQQALLWRIGELAREYRGREGSLIQVLHMAQGIYGYLPLEVQRVIADGLELPLAEVSGVVSFYSFFSTQRRGRHTIRVCLGTACYVRGGKRIVERLRELLKVEVGDTTADGLFTLEVCAASARAGWLRPCPSTTRCISASIPTIWSIFWLSTPPKRREKPYDENHLSPDAQRDQGRLRAQAGRL